MAIEKLIAYFVFALAIQQAAAQAEPVDTLDGAVLWCQCASSSKSDLNHAGFGLENGWKYYTDRHIRPIANWYQQQFDKKLRIILHRPFGQTIDGRQTKMAINEYLQARREKLSFFYEGFSREIGGLVKEGHEVIVYLGSPHNTVEWRDDLAQPRKRDDVLRKTWQSLRLPIDSGCSIAFDNMSSLHRSTNSEATYWLIRSLGVKTYIEATLERDSRNKRLWDEPAIITWAGFNRKHRETQHSGAVGRFPKVEDQDWYGGEVIILFRLHEQLGQETLIARQYGTTPALTITRFKQIKETNDD